MFNFKVKRSDIPGGKYYDVDLIVDTGTSTVTINYGVVHENDVEDLANEILDEANKALAKVFGGRLVGAAED